MDKKLKISKTSIVFKVLFMLLVIFLTIGSICRFSFAEYNNKLIVLSSDTIDVSDIDDFEDSTSAGLLSLKSSNRLEENIYVNMAYGRTYNYDGNKFKDIDYGNSLSDETYSSSILDIMSSLENEYSETNKEIRSLGDILKQKKIKRTYLGTNDRDYVLLSDSNGKYDYGENIGEDISKLDSDSSDLFNKIDTYLEKSDILFLSLKGMDRDIQKDISKKLFKSNYRCVLISMATPDYGYQKNKSISVVMSNSSPEGLLSSDSTKREGIVSSLDIKPTVLNEFNIKDENSSGKVILSQSENNIGELLTQKLQSFFNLNLTKYIFHGLVIAINLLIILLYFLKSRYYEKIVRVAYFPAFFILFSIIYNFLSEKFYTYTLLIISSSILLYILYRKNKISIIWVPIITNILIIIGILFSKNIVYDSFIGYNNIAAGGRYYGFNNDIMGVLMATGIITSGLIAEKFPSLKGKIIGLLILFLNFIALTGNYGSNFGGLMTSIFTIVLYIYYYLSDSLDKNRWLMPMALISICIVFYFIGGKNSHISEFVYRISELGMVEFVDMIKKKISQLLYMTLIPPWSLIIIAQLLYIVSHIKKKLRDFKLIKIILAASVVALLLNDTGAIAFAYMNAYSIALIRYLGERGKLLNEIEQL